MQLTRVYDLVAVLAHQGRSVDSRRYVAWVKQENGMPTRAIYSTPIMCVESHFNSYSLASAEFQKLAMPLPQINNFKNQTQRQPDERCKPWSTSTYFPQVTYLNYLSNICLLSFVISRNYDNPLTDKTARTIRASYFLFPFSLSHNGINSVIFVTCVCILELFRAIQVLNALCDFFAEPI